MIKGLEYLSCNESDAVELYLFSLKKGRLQDDKIAAF